MGKFRLPKIRWPKPPPIPSLPDIFKPGGTNPDRRAPAPPPTIPAGDLEKAVRDTLKAAHDTSQALAHAVDDAVHLPEKVVAELDRNLEKLHEARRRIEKAAAKAVHDVADAGQAIASFTEAELRGSLEAAKMAMSGGNVFDSAWEAATSRIEDTNDNAMRAMRESAVLAAAAQIAASTYGGPAGSAAFSAWMAYNASESDLSLALRVGVTQGLVAAATGAAGKLPAGTERIAAENAIKAAVGKLQGKSSEEVMREALSSLVTTAMNQLPTSDLNAVQSSLVSGATGGLAVAAAGGDHRAVADAFLAAGGQVLVQDVEAVAGEFRAQVERGVSSAVARAIDPETVAAVKETYDAAKAFEETQVERLVEEAKDAIEPYADQAKAAADLARAEADKVRAALTGAIDQAAATAEQMVILAAAEREKIGKLRLAAIASLEEHEKAAKALGAEPAEAIEAETKVKRAILDEQADKGLAELATKEAEARAAAEEAIAAVKTQLKPLRPAAIDQLLRLSREAPDIAAKGAQLLTDEWVVSWDKGKLLAPGEPIGVVLTFVGEGSQVAHEVDKVMDVKP